MFIFCIHNTRVNFFWSMATTFGCRPQLMFRITKIVFDSKYSSSLMKLLQYNLTYIHNIHINFCWPMPKTFGHRPQHIFSRWGRGKCGVRAVHVAQTSSFIYFHFVSLNYELINTNSCCICD